MQKRYTPALWTCILMDLIGCASYAVPVLGEASDIIWAPISAFIFYRMFGGNIGAFGGVFNFIEELFPGLDFIPTFTISWAIRRIMEGSRSKKPAAQKVPQQQYKVAGF
jgi:hypothetical protein